MRQYQIKRYHSILGQLYQEGHLTKEDWEALLGACEYAKYALLDDRLKGLYPKETQEDIKERLFTIVRVSAE
jgi:hypothetical protein